MRRIEPNEVRRSLNKWYLFAKKECFILVGHVLRNLLTTEFDLQSHRTEGTSNFRGASVDDPKQIKRADLEEHL